MGFEALEDVRLRYVAAMKLEFVAMSDLLGYIAGHGNDPQRYELLRHDADRARERTERAAHEWHSVMEAVWRTIPPTSCGRTGRARR